MEITDQRMLSTPDSTIGELTIAENPFRCFILEDGKHEPKIQGKTRIPADRYEIILVREGGFYERYTKRFGKDHPIMAIIGVKGFTLIRIHMGNDVDDTEGCLLACSNYQLSDGNYIGGFSERAYLPLHAIVVDAIEKKKERVFITVKDEGA